MRKIELHISDEFRSVTDDVTKAVMFAAVGHLTMWAEHNERYAHVVIYGDKGGSLNATYRAAEGGDVTYTLFMEYQPDTKTYSGPHS
jgi:hypothetical protein